MALLMDLDLGMALLDKQRDQRVPQLPLQDLLLLLVMPMLLLRLDL